MPVSQSIVDSLAAPPLAALQPVLDTNGPYSTGDYTLASFTTNGAFLLPAGTYDVGGTYGVIAIVRGAIPAKAGVRFGWTSFPDFFPWGAQYDRRICQLVLQHFLPITGSYITTAVNDVNTLAWTMLWPVLIGSGARLGLHVEPGWSVDLQYLCVL